MCIEDRRFSAVKPIGTEQLIRSVRVARTSQEASGYAAHVRSLPTNRKGYHCSRRLEVPNHQGQYSVPPKGRSLSLVEGYCTTVPVDCPVRPHVHHLASLIRDAGLVRALGASQAVSKARAWPSITRVRPRPYFGCGLEPGQTFCTKLLSKRHPNLIAAQVGIY